MTVTSTRPSLVQRAALAAAVCLAGLAILRAMVSIVPTLYFDVDPAADPWPAAGWGPTHALVADACSLLLAAFIYWVSSSRARTADALVALAALVPTISIIFHAHSSADDLWRGSGWLAAFVSASALWTAARCLPRGAALRASLLAVLLAVAGPLLLDAASQVFVEHGRTVVEYSTKKEAILAARGWSVDSPQALMFERRLMQIEATGWFVLSNIMSSLLGAMAVALGAMAVVGWRHLERGTALLLTAAAIGCGSVVAINGSKGAIVAVLIGITVAFVARKQRPGATWASWLGIAAVAVSVAAIVARGLIGETSAERSLLFRWHYLQGAMDAWLKDPWLGTGPAGFAQAYLGTRPDRAPEEVISAHSMWADWVASLGVLGLAWVAVVLVWLWLAGSGEGLIRVNRATGVVNNAPTTPGRRFLLVALGVVLAACALAIIPEFHTLDALGLVLRGVGMTLAVVLVVAVVQTLEVPSRSAAAALLGASVVLAVHAQIEMTLWNASSVGWVLAFIAVTAAHWVEGQPVAAHARIPAQSGLRVASMAAVVLAGATVWWGALPAAADARRERAAAEPIAAYYDDQTKSAKDVPHMVRESAARMLLGDPSQLSVWGRRPLRLSAALMQWAQVLNQTPPAAPEFVGLATRARASALAAVDACPSDQVLGAAQIVARSLMRATEDVPLSQQAAQDLRHWALQQLKASPRDVNAWLNLGMAYQALGEQGEAQLAWRMALEADLSYALDPLRQLGADERAELRRGAGLE
jgi:hypothetical protein